MIEQVFYAHTLEHNPNPDHWQLLEDHLYNVAALSAEFTESFESEKWGYLAGLWHDLGKYQPAFQERLCGSSISVEHSGLGAALAYHINKDQGIPLAFVIAGHHAGLANLRENDPNSPSVLLERLKINSRTLQQLRSELPIHIIEQSFPELPAFLKYTAGMGPNEQMTLQRHFEFWIRFLFSSLVDGDRLDTEAFLNPEQALLRGKFESIDVLQQRIDAFIDGKIAELSKEEKANPVNQARSSVLDTCRKAALHPPGIFSLTVPTGGGKTLSAMSFALRHAKHNGLQRVIVVIPYTSIIEQNADVYCQALGTANVIEHHASLDSTQEIATKGEEVTRQHALAVENWDAPIIVTTSVQFFESLFSNRPSRCRKLHNIARSVIILDEVQTLPPGYLLSILDALNELASHYHCSVVLSTATPPALAARNDFELGLANIRAIIPDVQTLSQTLKRVEYIWPDSDAYPVEWDDLAKELAQHEQVLVIVHKRDDARILAQMLEEEINAESIFHLSALMCAAHRADVLKQIKETLRKGSLCYVVSTQLVEAGVDLDFPVVYRALGGLDSMVQAAGRCNREGRLERGHVKIFQAPTSPPPGTPRKALQTMESLLKEGAIDPDVPSLFEAYFRMLYFSENQDAHNIQMNRQQFNFAFVNRDFRLIEDGFTETVIVPYGTANKGVEMIKRHGPNRKTLRGLQPFVVNVYPQAFDALVQAGALDEVVDGIFALSPIFAHNYDKTFGLIVGDELHADPGGLIR